MRSIAVILALLALQEPPDDAARKLGERAERAADWLADADADLRAMGRKEAGELGSAAVPALEKRISEKGLLDLAKAWREASASNAATRFVPEAELETIAPDDPAVKEMQKIDRAFVEKYLRAKYAEAMGFVHKRSYQRAFDLTGAILALEPRASMAESVRKLRRHCDSMILQTTLLEARLMHAKPCYVVGESVDLSLRLKNIFRSGLTLSFGKAAAGQPAPRGVVIVEVETTLRDFYGATQTWTRSQEVFVENEIPVASGGQWEKTFVLDANLELGDREHVREMVVNAWTQPVGIEVEGRDAGRRVQFESAFVRLVPKKYERFLENPLEWLGKTVDAGTAQETYICSRLLEGKDRDAGTALLVAAMEKTDNAKYRSSLSWILKGLTGQTLGEEPKPWRDWLDGKGKKTK
jgi:hypothetical protein